jgi:alanyl-tRNA synthetase
LVPENDPTVLFTTAGMHPLVPYLLGEKHPEGKRLVNVQKCVRTNDIDDVGDSTHNTFFEMLGNWSLGDYFKQDSIRWSWEFLTDKKWLGIDPQKIKVTVFEGDDDAPRDEESIKIWQECFKKNRINAEVYDQEKKNNGSAIIFPFSKKDNWWNSPGETGPCGPDTEIFIDLGRSVNFEKCPNGNNCKPGCSCGRYVEIWNNVFMEYNKTAEGRYVPLEQKNVDTGMGMERTLAILNGFDNVYETDVLAPAVAQIQSLKLKVQSKVQNSKMEIDEIKSIRIIADHIRSSVFIISDGVVPSNLDRGYVLRRLLRRAVRHGRTLNMPENFLLPVAETVIDIYKEFYPELEKNRDRILEEIKKEEEKFEKALGKGLKVLSDIKKEIIKLSNILIREKKLTDEEKKFLKKDRDWIWKETSEMLKEIADSSQVKLTDKKLVQPYLLDGSFVFRLYTTYGFPVELIKEDLENCLITINENSLLSYMKFSDYINKKIFNEETYNKEFKKHQELSRTASAGKFKGGLADTSKQATKYHTATHLLLESLRRVLGDHVYQRGSNITDERMRFDFSHPDKLTSEEIKKVENLVNEQMQKKLPVSWQEMELEEAKKLGVMGVFESKYGRRVKVYTIGSEETGIFSREICGGPHVNNTSELGKFKIKKEQSSSAGVRRIKAILE